MPGFNAQPLVFFTVTLALPLEAEIKVDIDSMLELMRMTGWLVSISTAGVLELRLRQLPV